MLLIDDLLAAPLRGLLFVLREIANAVAAERAAEEQGLMAELGTLHRRLDAGEIAEAEFEAAESRLLERLECLRTERADAGSA
jgi:gas vesicle protein GvpG